MTADWNNGDSFTLARQVGAALRQSGRRVSAAESCTGGLLLSTLTDIAGSSAYVEGGLVTYSNDAKRRLLNVPQATLIQHGAVSEATAAAMAVGVRRLFDTDYALSVTGIAGPSGGTDEKSVGLTYIGLAGRDNLLAVQRYDWAGDRIENKIASVKAALTLLLSVLE